MNSTIILIIFIIFSDISREKMLLIKLFYYSMRVKTHKSQVASCKSQVTWPVFPPVVFCAWMRSDSLLFSYNTSVIIKDESLKR